MPGHQGHKIGAEKIERVKTLLRQTEMTFVEIAERVNISGSVVGQINREHGIRHYHGSHYWTPDEASTA